MTIQDLNLLYEVNRRQSLRSRSKLEALKSKAEFNLEEWVRFISQTVVNLDNVVIWEQYKNLMMRREIKFNWEAIDVAISGINSIPYPPPPPYSGPHGPSMCNAEWKIDKVISLLGGGSYNEPYP